MAAKPNTTDVINDIDYGNDHFVVTVRREIGRVDLYDTGKFSPAEAAYLLIAQADEPGTYEFPMPHGGTCVVHVEHNPPTLHNPLA